MTYHPTTAPPRNAFTLTELLVVVAVIAILAAIALPVMQGMRSSSRRVGCTTNLRQIATALVTFAGDHNANFPMYAPAPANDTKVKGVRCLRLLAPKYAPAEIFACPAGGGRIREGFNPDKIDFDDPDCRFDDIRFGGSDGSVECSYGYDHRRRIGDPSGAGLVADHPPTTRGPHLFGSSNAEGNSPNHEGRGQNVAFMDGRVRWLTTRAMKDTDPDIYARSPELPPESDTYILWNGY